MPNPALATILADLERHKTIFDLDQNGLARKLTETVAAQILREMESETGPDGQHWAPLSEAYAEYKAKVAPGETMSKLRGRMRTLPELIGLARITPRECVQVYGTTEETRQEAEWFQEGRPGVQEPRPFYGLSAECEARLDEVCRQHLDSLV